MRTLIWMMEYCMFVPSANCLLVILIPAKWKILFPKRKDRSLLCQVLYFLFRTVLTCLKKTKLYILLQVEKTECFCNGCLGKKSLIPQWNGEMLERDYWLVVSTVLPMITMFISIWFIYNIQSLHIINDNKKISINAAHNKLRNIFVSFPLKKENGSNVVYEKNTDFIICIVLFLQTQLESSFHHFIQRIPLFNSQAIYSNVLFYYSLNTYSSEAYLDYITTITK